MSHASKENLFEIASRQKFRFESGRGDLTVEQLWGLPLSGAVSLDSVAVGLNAKVQNTQTVSFVNKVTSADVITSQKLELVKYIIQVRLEEKDAAQVTAEKASLRRQLREAIAEKKNSEMLSGSVTELEKRLAELED